MKDRWMKPLAAALGVAVITIGSMTVAPGALAQGGWGVFWPPTAECIGSCPNPDIFPCCVPEPLEPIIVEPEEP